MLVSSQQWTYSFQLHGEQNLQSVVNVNNCIALLALLQCCWVVERPYCLMLSGLGCCCCIMFDQAHALSMHLVA